MTNSATPKEFIERGSFLRSVVILARGTGIAQLVLVLLIPIITRIYSPGEFGVLAIYASWVSILAILASLRIEIAIPLPEKDEEAASLLILATGSIILLTVLITGLGLAFPEIYSKHPNIHVLDTLIWAVPLGTFATSTYSILQYWATRKKRYRATANIRIYQSVIESTSQISTGISGLGGTGLIGSQIVGRIIAVFFLAKSTILDIKSIASPISWNNCISLAYKYRRFPLISTPDALINSASLHVPIILISIYVDPATAGILFMALKLLQLPIGLLANAISQVYLTELPSYIRDNKDSVMTRQVIKDLADFAIGPIIFVTLTADTFIGYFLGGKWIEVGELMTWMAPWMISLMLVSPISVIFHAKNFPHISLLTNCFGLLIRTTPIVILNRLGLSDYIILVFILMSTLYYLIRLYFCTRFADASIMEAFIRGRTILILTAWLTSALTFRAFLS